MSMPVSLIASIALGRTELEVTPVLWNLESVSSLIGQEAFGHLTACGVASAED